MCLQVYADSEGPDKPVHPLTESWDTQNVWMETKGLDNTLRMGGMI